MVIQQSSPDFKATDSLVVPALQQAWDPKPGSGSDPILDLRLDAPASDMGQRMQNCTDKM